MVLFLRITLLTMMMPAPSNENDNEIYKDNDNYKSNDNENYYINETDGIFSGGIRATTVFPCWGLRDTITSSVEEKSLNTKFS